MSRSTDIKSKVSRRIVMAPGTILQVPVLPGQDAIQIKIIGSGGTLEIGGSTLAQAIIGATYGLPGATFGGMYPLSANEIHSENSSSATYLWNSGATTTVGIIYGLTVPDGEAF